MRSRNFAGKKNARRITASKRLLNRLKDEQDIKKIAVLKTELENLDAKITSDEVARSSRTKKWRGVGIR